MSNDLSRPVLPAKSAILFDLDGVLINSEPIHELSLLELSDRFGRRFTQEEVLSFKGLPEASIGQIFQRHFPNLHLTGEQISDIRREIVKTYFHEVQLIKGALEFVQKAKAAGYRLGLTTSAAPDLQLLAFTTFQLDSYFDGVVTGADVTRGKPDPEPYLTTAARVGFPAAECFVIEDAVSGVRSGKTAGAYVIAITTSFPAATLQQAGADYVAPGFAEIALPLPATRKI